MDRLLCSINDRLGGKPGENIPPLTGHWFDETVYASSFMSKAWAVTRKGSADE